ncbi:MAG: 30S ribosomal protein S17 [Nanoarchaeota archaeon]|nr:30S ribosomal protein S17 [Nanoarchaeota archaeon]
MKKSIGIPVKAPEKVCEDVKCPWHGKLSVRGRVFSGKVTAAKSKNTAIVEWSYTKLIPKYRRSERRSSHVTAYVPPCIPVSEGTLVTIAECRRLSKTKAFVVVG